MTACKESLKQLSELAAEADDLRAQALFDCCQFDGLLELGRQTKVVNHLHALHGLSVAVMYRASLTGLN